MPTVLVVDDEIQVSQFVAAVLECEGFSVLTAHSGRDAIDLAEAHLDRIDLLVTDIVMPEMDGIAVARRVQAVIPGVPVIFMSGACDLAALDAARSEQFLQKPFTPARLVQLVQNLAANSRTA